MDTVLDLGCAGGRNTVLLAERGFDVWAVDASDAVAHGAEQALNVLRARDVTRHPQGLGERPLTRVGQLVLLPGEQDHPPPPSGHCLGRSEPNSGTSPGDNNYFFREILHR